MLRIGSLGRRFGTLNFKRFEDVKRIPSCSVRLFSTEEPTYTPPPVYSEEAEKIYKTKFESYRVWGNHLLLKEHGRFFDADKRILMEKESKMFPMVHALALDNSQVTFPDFVEADVRLVCVSFKGFGYEASKAWIEPFRVNFEGNNRVKVAQLFCHEYGFLKFLSSLFVQAAQKEVGANREGVAVKVGDVKNLATALLLPSKFTGYIFLIDKKNVIRWRACGYPTPQELEMMMQFTRDLLTRQ